MKRRQAKQQRLGYIYLIKNWSTNNYKVGYSINPQRRLKQLQTGCDGRLSIVAQMAGHRGKERLIHKRLASTRLRGNGEWFTYSPTLGMFFRLHPPN